MKPSPKPTRIEDACSTLEAHLFGYVGMKGVVINREAGNLGIGSDRIFVFVRAPMKQWRGSRPLEWEGWPLEWRFGVGPAKAYVAS